MNAHHADGTDVGLGEWNGMQTGLITQWEEYERAPDKNAAVMAWSDLFAALTAEICKRRGVPIESYQEVMRRFENEIASDIELLKWFMSEHAHADVGMEAIVKLVRTQLIDVIDPETQEPVQIRLQMQFPYVSGSGEVCTREVDFPLGEGFSE